MKKLLFILIFMPVVLCNAQDVLILNSGDTLKGRITSIEELHVRITKADGNTTVIPQSMIKVTIKDNEIFEMPTAGSNLIAASKNIITGIVIITISAVAVTAGIAIAPALAVPLSIAGGVGILIGSGVNISAWAKIKAAGEILKKNRL